MRQTASQKPQPTFGKRLMMARQTFQWVQRFNLWFGVGMLALAVIMLVLGSVNLIVLAYLVVILAFSPIAGYRYWRSRLPHIPDNPATAVRTAQGWQVVNDFGVPIRDYLLSCLRKSAFALGVIVWLFLFLGSDILTAFRVIRGPVFSGIIPLVIAWLVGLAADWYFRRHPG